jgi:S-DNA-T family DNA segregation ATPase FtsK/SpoIIIE
MPLEDQMLVKTVIGKIYELGRTAEFVGPIVTGPRLRYFGLRPTNNTKVTSLEDMSDDLAVVLGVESVLLKRMPGQGVVGCFIPRKDPQSVSWFNMMAMPGVEDELKKASIPLLLGINWQGRAVVNDLSDCPHLLISGSTGGGKSVLLRTIIATICQYKNQDEVQLVLSDSKGVEFTDFDASRNLKYPRATSPIRTIEYMDNLCMEVDQRLNMFAMAGCKNIREWNDFASSRDKPMPYICLVIDELADIVCLPTEKGAAKYIGAEKLDYITRKARAAGIHVIAAVQRPSVDVVKGVIKNNFPSRLTFKMPSQIDSRVVLDTEGAEHLLGVGDCLFKGPTVSGLLRLHTGIANYKDIKAMLDFVAFRITQEQQMGGVQ